MSVGFTDRSGLVDPAARNKPVCVVGVVIDDRKVKAVLIADKADMRITAWLPRSEISIEKRAGGSVLVTMPMWLAAEKGLLAVAGEGQGRLEL